MWLACWFAVMARMARSHDSHGSLLGWHGSEPWLAWLAPWLAWLTGSHIDNTPCPLGKQTWWAACPRCSSWVIHEKEKNILTSFELLQVSKWSEKVAYPSTKYAILFLSTGQGESWFYIKLQTLIVHVCLSNHMLRVSQFSFTPLPSLGGHRLYLSYLYT